MKILAADTALGACSVALVDGGSVLAHRMELMDRGHAERLAPMADEAMREAGIAFCALDRLAVTTGPGTFTGQRVGLAFMRGLRVALKCPLVGITTLEAMAAAAMAETGTSAAAVVHDARRGEVYFALISKPWGAILPVAVASFEDAIAAIRLAIRDRPSDSFAFAGTAAEAAVSQVQASVRVALISSIRQPDALFVAMLAAKAQEPDGPPTPLYLRSPDARLPATMALRP